MTIIKKNKEINGNCKTFGGTRNVAEEILNPHTKNRSMANNFDRKEHFRFIGKPLSRLNDIAHLLPEDHICLLERYGAWMEALLSKEIKPLTEAQKKFTQVVNGNILVKSSNGCITEKQQDVILNYSPTCFRANGIKRYSANNVSPNLGISESQKLNLFKQVWINSVIVRDRNQAELVKRERQLTNSVTAELDKRERKLSNRVTNVGSFSNYKTKHNEDSNLGGGFGFITGIVLAVLAFSIVPVIPIILAFFAGHWLNYNFGKN